MKNKLFSPIVITITLAILAVSALILLKPTEEKILQKAVKSSSKFQAILENNQKNEAIINTSSLLTAERIYTEAEIKNTTALQFEEMLKDTELKLPSKKEIKEIPAGALHHTPELIMEAGRNLGALKEVLKFHPEYEPKVIPVYLKCAHDNDHPTPVRALCLTNLIEISKRHQMQLNLLEFPNEVVDLTKIVTDL